MKINIDDTTKVIDYLLFQYKGADPRLVEVSSKNKGFCIIIEMKTSSRSVGQNTFLLSAKDLINFEWININDFEEKFICQCD